MSIKRTATTELNHENWDQDDPADHEEMGSFKTASQDVLEKRVIRTAKRRSQLSSGDDAKKGVFSGFGGFNKTQPSSFDFLANLTNGNKSNGSPSNKTDTSVSSSLFNSKPLTSSPGGGGLFSTQVSSTPTKTTFGTPTTHASSLFGGSNNSSSLTSLFTGSKADSTVIDSPFKIQSPVSSSSDTGGTEFLSKTTNAASKVSTSQVSSSLFGAPTTTTASMKSLFSTTNNKTTPFTVQPVSSTTSTTKTNIETNTKSVFNAGESNKKVEENDKKLKYYAKLKGLNESVSDWIKKHVEETPLCILSPIFKDYEKYLTEIQDEYQGPVEEDKTQNKCNIPLIDSKPVQESALSDQTKITVGEKVSPFAKGSPNSKSSAFIVDNKTSADEKPTGFSFGTKTIASAPTNSSVGFSFGIGTQSAMSVSSAPLSFTTNTSTTNANGTTPFSFGLGKPFSFNSNIQKDPEPAIEKKDEDDEPPKVEFTPVVEENSVYDKRCKIFYKKDGIFIDRGVGTLYIKKIEESGKHQLLVRANTNLGNVLLNLVLASAIPTQRMGKNNVMLVCIPTPESKPPPTPILIRVKTGEEADELLETLNKFKA